MLNEVIPLTGGFEAIVDAEDYEWLMQWTWAKHPNGYANRITRLDEPNPRKNMMMHRQILNTPPDMVTDHINGNRLDNRRCNIRICTEMENQRNRIKHKVATSKYKGVSRSTRGRNGWEVMLYVKGKRQYIGHYASEIDGALAYNEAAKKVFGEFACLYTVIIPEGHIPEVKVPHASHYKGVSFHKQTGRWMAKVTANGKNNWLGMFATELEAARCFNEGAIIFGVPHKCYDLTQPA